MIQLWQRARTLAERCYSVEAHESQLLDRSIVVFVENPGLPGCMSHGDTLEEALAELKEARQLYLYTLLEDGRLCRSPSQPQAIVRRSQPDLIDESLWARAETLAAREYMNSHPRR